MSRGQPLPLQVRGLVDGLRRFAADVSGANDPASIGAARVLMRSIRKQLRKSANVTRQSFTGTSTRREASAPGEAPRSVTGKLLRSVGTEVVGGIRRVGVARFVGRLLEEGVDTTVNTTPSGRTIGTLRQMRGGSLVRALRRRKAGKARRVLKIAPRPFMEKALVEALPRMEGEAVSALQSRSLRGPALT